MYTPGTPAYVLNNLHIALQQAAANGKTPEDLGLDAVGYTSIDAALGDIEEVRDENPQRMFDLGDDLALIVNLTHEGIIADVCDNMGNVVSTFSNMADEFADGLCR